MIPTNTHAFADRLTHAAEGVDDPGIRELMLTAAAALLRLSDDRRPHLIRCDACETSVNARPVHVLCAACLDAEILADPRGVRQRHAVERLSKDTTK